MRPPAARRDCSWETARFCIKEKKTVQRADSAAAAGFPNGFFPETNKRMQIPCTDSAWYPSRAGGLWHTHVPVPQSGNLYPAGAASFLPAASHRKEVAVSLPASDLPYITMLFFRVRNGIGYSRRRQKRNALCPHAADGPGPRAVQSRETPCRLQADRL